MILNLEDILSPHTNQDDTPFGWKEQPMKGPPFEEPLSIKDSLQPQFSFHSPSLSATVADADSEDDLPSLGQLFKGEIGACPISPIKEAPPPQTNLLEQIQQFVQPPPQLSLESRATLQSASNTKMFLELIRLLCQSGTFAVIDNQLCEYNGIFWERLTPKKAMIAIRRWMSQHLDKEILLSIRQLRELLDMLITDPGLIWDPKDFQNRKLLVNCNDGVYDVMTGEILPSSPAYGFFSFVNVSVHDIGMGSHRYFDLFTQSAFDDSPKQVYLALELLGILIANVNLKKFFVFYGPSHTGKSQFGVFLQKLIGEQFAVSLTSIDDLGGTWTTGSMMEKRLCTCLDIPDQFLSQRVVSIVKQLVGDDPIRGERKYKDAVTFFPDTVLVFATNHPLKVPNAVEQQAFLNRMVVLPFDNPIPEDKQIPQLFEHLLDEIPYIVGQAIHAVKNLADRNFVLTEVVPATNAVYCLQEAARNEDAFAVARFIRECCTFSESDEEATNDLYLDFIGFCHTQNLHACSKIDLPRKILELFPALTSSKRVHGEDRRGIHGIALKRNVKEYNDTLLPCKGV